MIDARRWVLVEAWLALGLRIEWFASYEERGVPDGDWQDDGEGRRFVYDGLRTWKVLNRERSPFNRNTPTAPTLSTESLAHELAHYLSASPEQRQKRNFGFGDLEKSEQNDREEAAVDAEHVIDAVAAAASRIAELALRRAP